MTRIDTINLLGIETGRGAGTPGAQHGPDALRAAGLIEQLTALGCRVEDLGDIPGVHQARVARSSTPFARHLPHVLQVNRHTHAAVLGARRRDPGRFLLIVGGDHSLAVGTLAGLSDACQRLGLIWIDAHGDYNTPETSPSGNLHGMSLAIACGYGLAELRQISTKQPAIRESDVHLLAVRDIDSGERDRLDASEIHVLDIDAIRAAGVVDATTAAARQLASVCDHVHLSFDIDALDAHEVPGTGTPVPGGLTTAEAESLLAALGRTGIIASAEFVEYNPTLDQGEKTATLTLRLILALLTTQCEPRA